MSPLGMVEPKKCVTGDCVDPTGFQGIENLSSRAVLRFMYLIPNTGAGNVEVEACPWNRGEESARLNPVWAWVSADVPPKKR